MKFLERVFGPRIDPKDQADRDPDIEALARVSDETLRQVAAVLSPERQRVADSIRATATAVRQVQSRRGA